MAHEANAVGVTQSRSASQMAGLIWSVQPKRGKDERAQLFIHCPELLTGLFDQLSQLPSSTDPCNFKAWLLEAQMIALQSESRSESPDLATLEAMCAPLIWPTQQPPTADLSLQANLDNYTVSVGPIGDLPVRHEPDEQSDLCRTLRERVITQLRDGIAVNYVLGEVPCPARLSWISTMASGIRLSIEEVAIPTAVSVGLLLRWIARGQIRFVSSEPWFERTVIALLRSADLIDRQHLDHGNPALLGAFA
jgi:hypothetical protein